MYWMLSFVDSDLLLGMTCRDAQGPVVRKEAPHLSQDKSKEGLGELYEKEVRVVALYMSKMQCMHIVQHVESSTLRTSTGEHYVLRALFIMNTTLVFRSYHMLQHADIYQNSEVLRM